MNSPIKSTTLTIQISWMHDMKIQPKIRWTKLVHKERINLYQWSLIRHFQLLLLTQQSSFRHNWYIDKDKRTQRRTFSTCYIYYIQGDIRSVGSAQKKFQCHFLHNTIFVLNFKTAVFMNSIWIKFQKIQKQYGGIPPLAITPRS